MLQTISKENLHHTNICIGNRAEIISDIDTLISTFVDNTNHIERLIYEYDKFLIADARHIFSVHLHKTAKDSMQIIGIAFNATNNESQNSLLKMLEEPRANTYFFLIIPSKKIILDTVLSRAQVFEYKKEIEISESTKKFITATSAKRLEMVKKMLDELKAEKITKQNIIEFIEEIEKHVHVKKDMTLLKRILEIKEYLKDQGASVKQLLEYIAVEI
jgi:DNA polymerase III delta prime subunit